MNPPLSDTDLQQLDSEVERALRTGDESGLAVLGYGEISLVLGWPPAAPAFACKRLPSFPDWGRFDAYRRALGDYVNILRSHGVDVLDSELPAIERPDGSVTAYIVQPALDSETLAPAVLWRGDADAGHPLVEAIVECACRTVGPRLGVDAQISNWFWQEERLLYCDITTPLLWSADGRLRLDLDLLMQPLPAPMRWPVKRLIAPGILDKYRDRRGVMTDLCGNLIKERLDHWLPRFLQPINRLIEPPLSEAEAFRYYRSDARTWELLLRIRRVHRACQRRMSRPYPFLLPRDVER